MATIMPGLMTFEEFERLPECQGRQELLRGELIELPPEKRRHDVIAHEIQRSLIETIERIQNDVPRSDQSIVFIGTGYRVTRNPDSWLIPDVSVTHPCQPGDDYCEGAPLLAIEVVSPSNTPEQVADKVAIYLANGSRDVWVVYPKIHSIWVYREGTYAIVTGTLQTDLLPGLSIGLAEIFAD